MIGGRRYIFRVLGAGLLLVLLAAVATTWSGCVCFEGDDEDWCGIQAVVPGAPAANEFAGCGLVGNAQSCVQCTRIDENGGFEFYNADRVLDIWTGDSVRVQTRAERITGTPPDVILPCSWKAMVQMMATTPTGPDADVTGEIWQVIDLRGEALPDPAVATADLVVNRINRAFSDSQFRVRLAAYSGNPDTFPGGGEVLLGEQVELLNSDLDERTWEWLSTLMDVPAQTDFLIVSPQVIENARNETDEPEFFGHYLDGLRVHLGRKGAFDLRLAQFATQSSASTGQEVTFKLRLTLDGLESRFEVITDLRPADGLTYVSIGGDGIYDPVTRQWIVATINPGQTARLEIVARVDAEPAADARLTNSATIVAGAIGDVVPGNNSAVAAVDVPRFIAFDLALDQSVSETTVTQGDSVHFTLTLANLGPTDANTFVFVDNVLPEGFTAQRHVATRGTYRSDNDAWSLHLRPALAIESEEILQVTAIAGIPGTFSDAAFIRNGLGRQDNSANNADSVVVNVLPSTTPYDLELTVEAEASPFPANGYGGFVFRLRNNGPTIASGIVVQDVPPAGLVYAANLLDAGTYDPATTQWTVPVLLPGQTVELLKRFRRAAPGTYVHGATIIAGVDDDPNPGNDVDNASLVIVAVQPYDVAVSLAFPDSLRLGDEADLVVTLANAGPGLTPEIAVELSTPSYIGSLSHAGEGDFLSDLGLWTLGRRLPAGESTTLTIRMLASRGGSSSSIEAEILGDKERDTNDQNEESEAPIRVYDVPRLLTPIPDQTISVGRVTVLDMEDFFTRVDFATDYIVSVNDTSIVKMGDPLLLVEDTVATIRDQVSFLGEMPGTAIATVRPRNFDGFGDTDVFLVNVIPGTYDLEARVSSATTDYSPGQTIPYSIQVLKEPIDRAVSGIEVFHRIPPGLVYLSHTAVNGSYDLGTEIWSLDLASGATFGGLVINVRADTAGSYLALAQIAEGLDGDTDSSNDRGSLFLNVAPRYDLSMTVVTGADTIAVGEQILIDLFIGNLGGNTATGVAASFNLPPQLTYVSDTGGGAYNVQTGIWTVGDVIVGPFVPLRITAEGAQAGDAPATATIVGGLDGDFNSNNDSADVAVVVTGPVIGALSPD